MIEPATKWFIARQLMPGIYLTYFGVFLWFLRVKILRGVDAKALQDYLDTFATKGMNIIMLFACSCLSGILWMWTYIHFGAEGNLVMGTFGTFTGFTGALLAMLSGSASKQQMLDRTIPSATNVDKAETVNVQTPTPAPATQEKTP